jgi:hypothetical protein
MKRTLDLDATVAARARDVLTRALEGGRRLDRAGLYAALEASKIRCSGMRGQHILLWLAMDGTLCQTGRIGRQHAFALLDEWLPESRVLTGDAAFAELARRYFTSHGPASLQDFAWWAGLTAHDAVAAIDAAGGTLRRERLDDRDLWSGAKAPRTATARKPHVALLPAFDEYTVAYKDRTAIAGNGRLRNPMALLNPLVIVDGLAVGVHLFAFYVRDSCHLLLLWLSVLTLSRTGRGKDPARTAIPPSRPKPGRSSPSSRTPMREKPRTARACCPRE